MSLIITYETFQEIKAAVHYCNGYWCAYVSDLHIIMHPYVCCTCAIQFKNLATCACCEQITHMHSYVRKPFSSIQIFHSGIRFHSKLPLWNALASIPNFHSWNRSQAEFSLLYRMGEQLGLGLVVCACIKIP